MNDIPLLSTYFRPVQWYQKLNRYDARYLESYNSYVKQTYRNRCDIAMADGVQVLSIPVEKYDSLKCSVRDIHISDHVNWRHLHWNALQSAYGEGPFFEYYADNLHPLFTKKWIFLYDFNLGIAVKVCQLLAIEPNIQETATYVSTDDLPLQMPQITDPRDAIRPKHPLPNDTFMPRPYYQVCARKRGFIPDLSILDLLMNIGNKVVLYLQPFSEGHFYPHR